MPAPTTDLRVRPDIAEAMLEIPFNMVSKPVALMLFPVVEVEESEGTQGLIPSKELLTETGGARTGEGGYLRNEFQFTEIDWETKENGGEGVIDERKKKKYMKYFDHETMVAALERHKAFLRRERRCAAILNNTGNYSGQTNAAGVVWTNHASAVPLDDAETAVQAVYARTGIVPNTFWMSWLRFRDLRRCDQVIEAIQAAGAGNPAKASDVTIDMLSAVFDIEHIVVGGMPYNTANPAQNKSVASVWSDTSAGVAYIDHSGVVSMPTHTRTYHWGEDGSTMDGLVESYYEEKVRKNIVRVRQDTDEKQVLPELGQLITTVAA